MVLGKQQPAVKFRKEYYPDVPYSTFNYWCITGALPGVYKLGGSWIIDVEEWKKGIGTLKKRNPPCKKPGKRPQLLGVGKNR
jgi:hypothetical protein